MNDPASDRVARWTANHLPRRVRYWALIAEGVEHIGGPTRPHEEVPAVPFTEVLARCGRVLRS